MNNESTFQYSKRRLLRIKLLSVLVLVASIAGVLGAANVNSPTEKGTGFDDGTISPFSVCTTKHPDYGGSATLTGLMITCNCFGATSTYFGSPLAMLLRALLLLLMAIPIYRGAGTPTIRTTELNATP